MITVRAANVYLTNTLKKLSIKEITHSLVVMTKIRSWWMCNY